MSVPTHLPPGAKVLHIGPFKTGSTSLQHAFHAVRDRLPAYGAEYVGLGAHNAAAARHVIDKLLPGRDGAFAARSWGVVTDAMRADTERRRVFSSEYLSAASDAQIERIVSDIGPEDTYVVLVTRALGPLLPSQYQQYLVGGLRTGYHNWLKAIFDEDQSENPTPTFWSRHRHDHLAARWARVVGPSNVVAIVWEPTDYAFIPRSYEQLLGLPAGVLTEAPVARSNRSLSWPEAELVRQFNIQFHDSDVPLARRRILLRTAVSHLKDSDPGVGAVPITTPRWAVDRAAEVAAEIAQGLRATGVRVVGDLSWLQAAPATSEKPESPPTSLDAAVAARFAIGLSTAGERSRESAIARAVGRKQQKKKGRRKLRG